MIDEERRQKGMKCDFGEVIIKNSIILIEE